MVSVPPRGALRLAELGIDAMKNVHIPNAGSVSRVAPSIIPKSVAKLLSDARECFVLAYTGAIGVMQDFDTLVASVTQLEQRFPDYYARLRVIVVGGGVAAETLRQQVSSHALAHVVVHGAISKAAAQSLLLRADAVWSALPTPTHFVMG